MTTFVAIVESGSITAAAKRLSVAKSAVSRRLVNLEEELGTQLLLRTTRRQSLTEAGRFYLSECQRILDDVDAMESELKTQQCSLRGTLKIALPAVFSIHHLPSLIDKFRRLHPELIFHIDFNDRRLDLVHEGFDLALRIGQMDDSNLKARKLFHAQMAVCASPEYLRNKGTPLTPDDLASHDIIHHGHLPGNYWRLVSDDNKEQRVTVRPSFVSNHGDFNLDAAIRGKGVIMMPRFICYQALASGALVEILSDYRWNPVDAMLLYSATRHLNVRARTFIEFLCQAFAGSLPWDTKNAQRI